MMPFAPWGAAYAGIVALWAVAIAVERRPTLWKGQSLLILNVRFAAITGGVALVRGERPDNALVAFVISIIVVGLLVSRIWLLLHIDWAGARDTVEKCLSQTRAKYEMNAGRYIVRTKSEDLIIAISGAPPAMRVRLSGGRGSKKAGLIRALFGKQFSGSVPTLRVRT